MSRALPLVFALCLAIPALPLRGQESERHLTHPRTRAVCGRSAFLHGYIHGYEDGFHEGNLDLNLGRAARPVQDIKAFRHMAGYRDYFGDHGRFRSGYQQGFRVAYQDAMQGDRFRGWDAVVAAGDGLDSSGSAESAGLQWAAKSQRDEREDHKLFDEAFSSGYDSGRTQAARSRQPDAAEPQCPPRRSSGWCDVFSRGFRLGFDDALLPHHRALQTAKK